MSQGYVFVSYSAVDRPWVMSLAQSLVAQGFDIWWDRTLFTGDDYELEISDKLNASSCVIVVWSQASVRSQWVRSEAERARRKSLLVPVRMDSTEVPLVFERLQSLDLSNWDGSRDAPAFQTLMQGVARKLAKELTVGAAPSAAGEDSDNPLGSPQPAPVPQKRRWVNPLRLALAGVGLLLAIGGVYLASTRESLGAQQEIALDTLAPQVLVQWPPADGSIEAGDLLVQGTVNEEGCRVLVNGEEAEVLGHEWSRWITVTTADVQVAIRAVDAAGNWTGDLPVRFKVSPPPEVPGEIPPVDPRIAVEKLAGAWAAAWLSGDAEGFVAVIGVPFYYDNEVLLSKSAVREAYLKLLAERGASWKSLTVSDIKVYTARELQDLGQDLSKDRVFRHMSLGLDDCWAVVLTLDGEGMLVVVRAIGQDFEIVGTWD